MLNWTGLQTLIRDSHRCVLSRAMDDAILGDYPALYPSGSGVPIRFTDCAYIFDESINVLSTATVLIAEVCQYYTHHPVSLRFQQEYATNLCTILGYMGFPGILDELQGAGVHSLRNTMTLSNQLHRYFDSFRLWLEETVRFRFPIFSRVTLIPGISRKHRIGIKSEPNLVLRER